MIRFSWGLAGCLIAVALVASAGAQEGQKGRGRGRAGGLFGGDSLISLATREAVQKELGVGEAEKAKIETISRESNEARREEMSAAGGGANFQNLSDDEREKLFAKGREISAKINAKFEPKLKEALTADQFKRLQEIFVQAAGPAALSEAWVVKELAITDEQTKKIADIRADYQQKTRSLFGQGFSEETRAKLGELRDEEAKQVNQVLTKEQQDKLAALKGKEFDVSVLRQGRGGPGGDRPGARPGGTKRTKRPATE